MSINEIPTLATALAAANERIRELEENDEIIREDYQRLLANAKRCGSELEVERGVSDKLEKALNIALESGNDGDWQSARQEITTALAEVSNLRNANPAIQGSVISSNDELSS